MSNLNSQLNKEDLKYMRMAGRTAYGIGIVLMLNEFGWSTVWGLLLLLFGSITMDYDYIGPEGP